MDRIEEVRDSLIYRLPSRRIIVNRPISGLTGVIAAVACLAAMGIAAPSAIADEAITSDTQSYLQHLNDDAQENADNIDSSVQAEIDESSICASTQQSTDKMSQTIDGTSGYIATFFESCDGGSVPSQTLQPGGKIANPGTPKRDGYVFTGWYTDLTAGKQFDFAHSRIESDVLIYAGWRLAKPPVFTGVDDVTIDYGSDFGPKRGITVTDANGRNIRGRVVIDGTVDTSKAGTYTLVYKVTDSVAGRPGNTTTVVRRITVKARPDTKTPTIYGAWDAIIDYGSKFDAKDGVTAEDDVDGDLTDAIKVTGSVNTSKAGTYTLTYTVSDKAGNKAAIAREITVKEKPEPSEPSTPSVSFVDVNASTPHAQDISWLASTGISTGWKRVDGKYEYRGMSSVVRQDMAAFLYRLAGSPAFDAAKAHNPFRDVTPATPHYREILWLSSTGISTGWKDGTFRGMDSVKRQDMAAFLHRFADYRKASPELGAKVAFRDVTSATPHADDIDWLARAGVATGWKDGTFRGMDSVKRQDMAAFLHRMNTNVAK